MPNKLLLQAAHSQLVLIDMQIKLAPAMQVDAMQAVIKNCVILLQAANLMQVHTIVTEQYPQGLGETMPELAQHFTNTKLSTKPNPKTAFRPTLKLLLNNIYILTKRKSC